MTILLLLLSCGAAPAADTVVVCPAAFQEALAPWVQYRSSQGHTVAVVPNRPDVSAIQTELRRVAAGGALKYVVLVGDAPGPIAKPQDASICTPTHLIDAKVNVHWGSEPKIATDNPYADLDGDGIPDLAVGRLPADSPEELAVMVRKILSYEQTPNTGRWSHRVNLIAGIGGFGYLADAVLEMATRKFLVDGVPPAYRTTMTYGSWQSPYCPDPRSFRQVTIDRLNEGCLFWVYIGHGARQYLDYIRVPGGAFPILDTDDAKDLRSTQGLPIALFLACYTAAFDGPADCLGEEMLRSPGGPVAVLGGSRVTMPYAMAVMGNAMMDLCFHERCETLGEVVLAAKRRLAAEDVDDPNRQLLDAIAAAISPAKDQLREERVEHLALFNLLGDPLLRVRYPDPMSVACEDSVVAGQPLKLHVESSTGGDGVLELVCRRDRLKGESPSRPQFLPTQEFLRSLQEGYGQANNRTWSSQTVSVAAGPSEIVLAVPETARGPCYARLLVQTKKGLAVGASEVFVRPPRPAASPD